MNNEKNADKAEEQKERVLDNGQPVTPGANDVGILNTPGEPFDEDAEKESAQPHVKSKKENWDDGSRSGGEFPRSR